MSECKYRDPWLAFFLILFTLWRGPCAQNAWIQNKLLDIDRELYQSREAITHDGAAEAGGVK